MDYKVENIALISSAWQKIIRWILLRSNNRSGFLGGRLLFYTATFILFLKLISVCLFIPLPQNIFYADITKLDLFHLLNENRIKNGLPVLVKNETLDRAAELKARDMIENGYFSHESPQGISPWFWFSKAGYEYSFAGENLAVGFLDSKNVYEAWLNSPSHKANLLKTEYREVGFAVAEGFGQGNAIVVVQLFASPLIKSTSVAPKAPVLAKSSIDNTRPAPKQEKPTEPPAIKEEPKEAKKHWLRKNPKPGFWLNQLKAHQ